MATAPWPAACRVQGVLRDLCADVKLPVKCLDTSSHEQAQFLNLCQWQCICIFFPLLPILADNYEKRFTAIVLGLFKTPSPEAQKVVVDLCKD